MSDIWRFGVFNTYAEVPAVALSDLGKGDADIVIVGAPIDWGTTFRSGTRFGPKAIREADYLDAKTQRQS